MTTTVEQFAKTVAEKLANLEAENAILRADNDKLTHSFLALSGAFGNLSMDAIKLRAVAAAAQTLLTSCCEASKELHGMLELEEALEKLK